MSERVVTYSFRRRSTSSLRDLLSPNHRSYTRRRCEGPMERRSIIHKMHVLERSFLPELKYSTSHSYHSWADPRWTSSLREFRRASPDTDPVVLSSTFPVSTHSFTPTSRLVRLTKVFLVGAIRRTFRSFVLYEPIRSIDRRDSCRRNRPLNLDENFAMHLPIVARFAFRSKRIVK